MKEKVAAALSKAAAWMASYQAEDGNWPVDSQLFNEPEDYHAEPVVTAQAAHLLLYVNEPRYAAAISRALSFCASYSLEVGDPTAWYAWKILTLRLTNSTSNQRQAGILRRALAKRQNPQGFWPFFPTTLNATNYMALDALAGSNPEAETKTIKWFKCSQIKGGGWGRDHRAKRAEPPSTGVVVLAMLQAGEAPDSVPLRAARSFLEASQQANGSWKTPRIGVRSSYATSCAALALMLLSKNPFNSNVKKAIGWLLKLQAPEGGWPFAAGSPPQFYTTYYACLTLAFWQHLYEQWKQPEIHELQAMLGPQATAVWLWRRFPAHLKDRLGHLLVRSMLDSKALGSTKGAIHRRKDILRVLSEGGPGDTAEVIDRLKLIPVYANLSKKSHITQIKADLDYLKDINLVSLIHTRYAVVKDLLRN